MNTCRTCGRMFLRNASSSYTCPACQGRKRIKESDEALDDFYSQGCRICGEKRRPCLKAAHRTPRKGDREIAISRLRGRNVYALRRQLLQCVPLCANCHRLVDAGWIEMPKDPWGHS